jgi:L-fucono-1,5-lactonase
VVIPVMVDISGLPERLPLPAEVPSGETRGGRPSGLVASRAPLTAQVVALSLWLHSTPARWGAITVIDAHHHLWSLSAHDYSWLDEAFYAPVRRDFGLTDLAPELAAAGVHRTVLVEAGSGEPSETMDLLALAEASAGLVAGVVGTIDLRSPQPGDVLDMYAAHPSARLLVGVRDQLQAMPGAGFTQRREILAGLAVVAERGLAYDLVVRADQLSGCVALVRALPQLRFVLDHLGKPDVASGLSALGPWRTALAQLAACENTTAKLSGLVTEADVGQWTPDDLRPFVETAVELFGPGRVMFGSDWPVCLVAGTYAQVLAALRAGLPALSPGELAEVFGGTAERVYGLGEHQDPSPTESES